MKLSEKGLLYVSEIKYTITNKDCSIEEYMNAEPVNHRIEYIVQDVNISYNQGIKISFEYIVSGKKLKYMFDNNGYYAKIDMHIQDFVENVLINLPKIENKSTSLSDYKIQLLNEKDELIKEYE